MARGSGSQAIYSAFEQINSRSIENTALGQVLPVELDDAETTTLRVIFRLMLNAPEASGFDGADIAAAALPEESPAEQSEYLPLIAETSRSLIDKGLAEEVGGERWKLTTAGLQVESGLLQSDLQAR
jgi:hypothetical protein